MPTRYLYFSLETKTQRSITFEPLSGAWLTELKWVSGEGKTKAKSGTWYYPSFGRPPFLLTQPPWGVTHWQPLRCVFFFLAHVNILKLLNYLPTFKIRKCYIKIQMCRFFWVGYTEPACHHDDSRCSWVASAPWHRARVLHFAVCPIILYLAHLTHSCYLHSPCRYVSL